MAKTVFTPGTPITSEFLNAINNPVFDGLEFDGHRNKISDDELDDNGIKARVNTITDSFIVTHNTGAVVDVSPGSYQDETGNLAVFAGDSLTLPTDGTFYIFIAPGNNLSFGEDLPPVCLALARVTTSGGVVAPPINDLRPRYSVVPRPVNVRVIGGYGQQKSLRVSPSGTGGWNVDNTEFTVIATTVSPHHLDGSFDYDNFIVESGAKITTNGAYIRASGEVTISGEVEVLPTVNPGAGFDGSVLAPSDIQSNNGQGIGGSGGHSAAPTSYSYTASRLGSGGGSSYLKMRLTASATFSDISDDAQINVGSGGFGGGYFVVEAAGSINVSGTIEARGGDAEDTTYVSGLPANQFILASGAGGGSGGLIHLMSTTEVRLTSTSTLDVRGGDGGSGYVSSNVSATYLARGGGGGAGGYLVLNAPSIVNNSVNIVLSGGSAGADVGTGGNALSGCPGAAYGGDGGPSHSPGGNGQTVTMTFNP